MAGSWAGAYGAGGASDALRQLLADRLTNQKFEEDKRRAKSDEDAREKQRGDTNEYRRQEREAAAQRAEAERSLHYEDRAERSRQFNTRMQLDQNNDEKRRQERADDREAGLEGEDRQRKARIEDREDTQNFQVYMDSRRAARERSEGGSNNEPLVSVKDPVTKLPRLVPRSQAAGMEPASTRDQAMTEGQSNASGFADRMAFNEQHIRNFETQAAGRGNQLMGLLPREMQTNGYQQYEAAKGNWIAATLRKESGAAISESEFKNAERQYFPQPGESPAVIEQKRQLRAVAEAAMRRASGAGMGMDAGAAPPAGAPTGGGAPMTRTIRNRTTGETRTQTSLDGGQTWN